MYGLSQNTKLWWQFATFSERMVLKASTFFTDHRVPDLLCPDLETYRAGFYAAGFWGPRQDNVGTATQRLARFLGELGAIHELFLDWYLRVPTPGADRVRVPAAEADLRQMLESEVSKTSRGTSGAAAASGATIGMWAGSYSDSAGLNIRFGYTDPRVGNAAVLTTPPRLNPLFGDIVGSRAVLDAIVHAWDPDRGHVRPRDMPQNTLERQSTANERHQQEPFMKRFPDWITYGRNSPLLLGGPFVGEL